MVVLAKTLRAGKSNPYPEKNVRMGVCSNENEPLAFPEWKESNVVNLPPSANWSPQTIVP